MKNTKKEAEEVVTEKVLTYLNDVDTSGSELNDTESIDTELEEAEEVVTEKVKKEKFLNPFDKGVTYAEFQKALGKKSIAEYCKGKITTDQLEWLENELSIINKK